MKIVAITGVYRSGSTWMFNTIKHILLESGYTVSWENNPYKEDALESDCDYHIVKMHEFFPKLRQASSFVFTSNRDFDEVKKSYQNLRPDVDVTSNMVRDFFIEYGKWQLFSDYDMDYHRLTSVRGKRDIVTKLYKSLFNSLPLPSFVDSILQIVENIKPPKEGFDPHTLLFDRHISDE